MGREATKSEPVSAPRGGSRVLRVVLIAGALAVLVAAGVVEGVFTNRWGVSEELRTAAARLPAIPPAFGDWTSTDDPIDPKVLAQAEATGAVSRVYRNTRTGAAVSVLVLCGPPGPIGSHTPDVCYSGLGYAMDGAEVRKSVDLPDGTAATYWTGRFAKSPTDPGLEVCWAWGTGGDWVASEAARRDFIGHNALYKLYASRGLPAAGANGRPGPDVVREFLTEFFPQVKKVLAPKPG